ncbi:MAG: hypothetical protein R3B48_13165 [Kofleriaceae bacterium]
MPRPHQLATAPTLVARAGIISLCLGIASCAFTDDDLDDDGVEIAALSAVDPSARAALARRWAPVHYQDVDQTGRHALGGAADYITSYDFDGDLNGRNNWDHAGSAAYPLRAHGYYSVVETNTHWYLVYLFFHPRDWTDYFFDTEHENDAEGVLFAVQRDGSTYGRLQAAVTVAHTNFYSYVPSGSLWRSGQEDVDGVLQLATLVDGGHPVTAQQAKGHGLKARPYYDISGGDGVVYYPSTIAEVPSGPNDRNVGYRLVDMLAPGGMWDQRNNTSLFAGFGSFAGDSTGGCGSGAIGCSSNAANAPWGWDDRNDGSPRGALATDPAGLVRTYFTIPETVSLTYTFNPFR